MSQKLPIGMLLASLLVGAGADTAFAQASYAPPNEGPNPYQLGVSWGQLPDGRKWGSTAGVDVAPDGTIWAYDRCGANGCGAAATASMAPILHFDTSGKLLGSFGAGLFIFPHGFHVDRDGNVWVTDGQSNQAAARGAAPGAAAAAAPGAARGAAAAPPAPTGPPKGMQVFKFSPEGKLLLTLGKPGVSGNAPDTFIQPSDVLVAPNGDIFVADGHTPTTMSRMVKFDKTGKFIKSWGTHGPGPSELQHPHALAMDSAGRLFVGDRTNNRIQVFDQEGKLLASWAQFGRPSGIFIDRNDMMYVTDSESNDTPNTYGYNPGVKRGIRFGSVKDAKVVGYIPDPNPSGGSSSSEGVAVDRQGNVYGAEVGPRDMKKYVKK